MSRRGAVPTEECSYQLQLRRRGTFYGGPESFLSHFSDRGPAPEFGFGNTLFGSCGYYQQVWCLHHAASSMLSKHFAFVAFIGTTLEKRS